MAEFPADRNSRDTHDQFLWGSGFMIAPIMEEYAEERGVYFPPTLWYDFYTNDVIEGGKKKLVKADMNTIPLFMRAGTILPSQGKRFNFFWVEIHKFQNLNSLLLLNAKSR